MLRRRLAPLAVCTYGGFRVEIVWKRVQYLRQWLVIGTVHISTTTEVANISISKQLYYIKSDLVFWYLALLEVHLHNRQDAVLKGQGVQVVQLESRLPDKYILARGRKPDHCYRSE